MKQSTQEFLNALDPQVETMMRQWNLPGLTLGIVKDGEILLTKGYGLRDAAENLPMTPSTILPIGSVTKSFTSLALAMLADDGKLDPDRPVVAYLPELKLFDPETTRQVTVRDLLCHRTGVPGYDIHSVFCAKEERSEMVKDLSYLEPSAPFRSKLQYQNQMVMLAGYLLEVLSGMSWQEFISERILKPLGMEHTCFQVAELSGYPEHSLGYLFNGTENIPVPYLPLKAVAPAGAINSTAEDMENYLLFQLGDGTWQGERLVSEQRMNEMHSVQMTGSPYFWILDEITDTNYGLGWFVDKYRGHAMYSHGGNTLGFSALMTLLPSENLGIIALTNATSNFMAYALTYHLLDEFLDVPSCDWTAKLQGALAPVMNAMAEAQQARAAARIPDAPPAHPIDAYCGVYTHPAFGEIRISTDGTTLSGKLNGFDMLIRHYQNEEFDTVLTLMGVNMPVTFLTGSSGKVEALTAVIEPTPGIHPVKFCKQ